MFIFMCCRSEPVQGVQVLAEEKQRRAGQGSQQVQAFNRQAQLPVKIFHKRLHNVGLVLVQTVKKNTMALSYLKSCEFILQVLQSSGILIRVRITDPYLLEISRSLQRKC
jgi:hypothetical protein